MGSLAYPCRDAVSAKACSKAQARGTHGKVGHGVEDKTDQLRNGCNEGEEEALQLRSCGRASANMDGHIDGLASVGVREGEGDGGEGRGGRQGGRQVRSHRPSGIDAGIRGQGSDGGYDRLLFGRPTFRLNKSVSAMLPK